MRIGTDHFKKILSFVLFCLVLFYLPVLAQEEEIVSNGPITKVDLGVDSLQLSVGESYTFHVTFEPENTDLTTLDWYVTDESVISIDPLTDTVTALAEGEARIFAESFDQASYDICTVTVGTSVSKDASVMKSGSDFIGLSPEELGKISAETLNRYLNFVADSALDDETFNQVDDRMFDVLAEVKPGTEEAQSQRARECGVEDSESLKELNSVTLYGSLESILKYIKGNEDLRDVYEFGPIWVDDPNLEEVSEESVEKAVVRDMGGNTQSLMNLNFARSLGLNGKGRTIAIIDSGLNRRNPVFARKPGGTITEACFSTPQKSGSKTIVSICRNGSTGPGSSTPTGMRASSRFNHGSHVAGIAAGADGVAPAANIISIQSHSELRWTCKADERQTYGCGGNMCCKTYISDTDLARSYNYIFDLVKKGTKIDVVNMSYGNSTEYKDAKSCAKAKPQQKKFMDRLAANGMLPVAATGNDTFNNGIAAPACHSSVYAVGGLANQKTPFLRNTSNHSRLVDIAAPGTDIWSANNTTGLVQMNGTSMAAPMVSGAVALVKQMYPGMDADDVGQFLKLISNKTVNRRLNGVRFNYQIPVLNFTNLLSRFTVPYYNWATGGDKSVTFKVDRLARNASFSAKVRTLQGVEISGTKTEWRSQGNYTYVKVSGPLTNGQIYKVELTRTVKAGGNTFKAVTTQYGRPVAAPIDAKKITIKPQDRGVSLNCSGLSVQYKIYDKATGALVRTVRTTSPQKFLDISGLVNGKVYSVTASEYRQIPITRNGVKKTVNFYGPESARVDFMPMSKLVNAMRSKKGTTYTFSAAADPSVNGIWVRYQKPGENKWYICCKSDKSKSFACSCNLPNLPQGTVFNALKYKILNNNYFYGPVSVFKIR